MGSGHFTVVPLIFHHILQELLLADIKHTSRMCVYMFEVHLNFVEQATPSIIQILEKVNIILMLSHNLLSEKGSSLGEIRRDPFSEENRKQIMKML